CREGTPADKFRHHAETPLPIPAEWPAELKTVVAKMTAKDPAVRYQTPAQAAAALEPLSRVAPAKSKLRRRWLPVAVPLVAVVVVGLLGLSGVIELGIVYLRIKTDKGEVVVQTDDPNLEIVTRKGGEIVRIRDTKSGQTWELDTKNLTMRDLEHPDGLALEVPWRGKVTLRSSGGEGVGTGGGAGGAGGAVPPPSYG